MIATDNIQEGELIAFIPRSMMVNYIDAEKDFCTICSEFEPVGWMTRSDYRKLAVTILQNRDNPFSPLYHWMQTLQTEFKDHLLNITNKQVNWFKGSQLIGK